MNDRSHARNALSRVAQHGTPKEKAEVKKKVEAKFPGMEKGKSDKGPKKIGTHTKRSAAHHQAIGSHEGYTMDRKRKK